MKIVLFILIIFFSQSLFAIENLAPSDQLGTWKSEWAVVEGESQTLVINTDKSSTFERHFKDDSKEIYTAKDFEQHEDLLIIKYNDEKGELVCKLVMSGWHSYGRYTLYGSMHMYNDGVQYNALTVALVRDKK